MYVLYPYLTVTRRKRLGWSCFVIANDKLVKIWSPNTGEFIRDLIGHTKGNSDISWSSDSVYLASASDDQTIRIWDVDSVRPYFFLHHGLSLKLENRELHPVFWKDTEIRYFVLTTIPLQHLSCLDVWTGILKSGMQLRVSTGKNHILCVYWVS